MTTKRHNHADKNSLNTYKKIYSLINTNPNSKFNLSLEGYFDLLKNKKDRVNKHLTDICDLPGYFQAYCDTLSKLDLFVQLQKKRKEIYPCKF